MILRSGHGGFPELAFGLFAVAHPDEAADLGDPVRAPLVVAAPVVFGDEDGASLHVDGLDVADVARAVAERLRVPPRDVAGLRVLLADLDPLGLRGGAPVLGRSPTRLRDLLHAVQIGRAHV